MAINYVKFQRGSQAAYDRLIELNNIDSNTLYFIYKNENATTGSLYMGDKLISGGNVSTVASSLDELSDVIVAGAETNSFLIKNDEGNWVAKTIEDVVALIQAHSTAPSSPAQIFQADLAENETHDAAITRITQNEILIAGDVVIIRDSIAKDKYEHTAYIYTGEKWAAMDGNYNATNVYFDTDLTITADIGVQEIDSTGSKILDTTGKNLKQVLDMIMASRGLPTRSNPSVTIISDEDNAYEVGSEVTLRYSATLNPGSYSYGPATGITASSWSVTFNNETLTTATGTFNTLTVDDNTKLRVSATATYDAGAAPKDNLGEIITDATELATCQIQAGNKVGYTNYVTGYRNSFYGSKTTSVELNSANIRALTAEKSTLNTLRVSIVEGARQVIIAVPEGRVVTKVADEGAFGTDIFSSFNLSTVSVGGVDATADAIGNYAKNYNVYVYNPSTALGANTYTVTIANG